MPLTGWSEEQIAKYEQLLLAQVPQEGSVGNTSLQRSLNTANNEWNQHLYWVIHNRLIERGHLERGRGKGGSVRRVKTIAVVEDAPTAAQPIVDQIQAERDSYDPMSKVIRENWSPDSGLGAVVVEITAQGGLRPDGRWSRPDVTLGARPDSLWAGRFSLA